MYKLLYGKYKALYLIVKKIKFSNPYIFGIWLPSLLYLKLNIKKIYNIGLQRYWD